METLQYIIKKYNVDLKLPSPFWLNLNRLTDLPQLFKELDFKVGAEIGVLKGEYSEILCKALSDTKIYSIDPWVYYPVYRDFRKAYMYEPLYQEAKARLAQYPNSEIIRKSSLDAIADFDNGSLDFIFIDADHRFAPFTDDLAVWTPKVRKGGIISGHDMGKSASKDFVHVRFVIPAWTQAYRIHPWFVLEAPQQRSWMWVN